jgi:catechol 2,3-dioxygenase-like lactoylglutathione lyase family enzyme
MKRFHVHVSVEDLDKSIRFYSTVFGQGPAVQKPDYAKWMLEDPRINFAISERGARAGVDHLGIQVDTDEELQELRNRAAAADLAALDQTNATCCYAKSDKYWLLDPQGVAWETYRTLDSAPTYGGDTLGAAKGKVAKIPVALASAACCEPAGLR